MKIQLKKIKENMEGKQGIWKIQKGKNNRVYIQCTDKEKIMHPQDLCGVNGLGIYGIEHLRDLAEAIDKFVVKSITEIIDLKRVSEELRNINFPYISIRIDEKKLVIQTNHNIDEINTIKCIKLIDSEFNMFIDEVWGENFTFISFKLKR